ncbi:hypothetical protein TcBrA4_0068710 [Trypanosoma cruzi]|nr:hypothetical protein TcBrA4_0068710 [Trypanosoma cruzi]
MAARPRSTAAAVGAADEEDEAPREKKKPNPLDELPPSPFVLDAFQAQVLQHGHPHGLLRPYFFQHYDAAGYTTFWCRYKYNEDNKMQFMTANLIDRVVPAHGASAPVRVGRCAHDCGGEAARHVALWGVPRPGACRRLWRTWRTRSCLTGRRSLTSRRSGSASRTTCAGRARRSRGLCWRGVCSSDRGVLV